MRNPNVSMNLTNQIPAPPVDIAEQNGRVKKQIVVSIDDSPLVIREKLASQGFDVSSLRVRPLTVQECREMHGTDAETWHLKANSANWDKAFSDAEKNERELAPIREKNRKIEAADLVSELVQLNKTGNKSVTWTAEHDKSYEQMCAAMRAAFKKYAQFACAGSGEHVTHNVEACFAYIEKGLLDPRQTGAWTTALLELAKRGMVIAENSEGQLISGDALKNSPELQDILSPALTVRQRKQKAEQVRINAMSSEEFFNSCSAEDQDEIISGAFMPGVLNAYKSARSQEAEKSYERAVTAFTSLCPTYDATPENQALMQQWHSEHEGMIWSPTSLQTAFRELCASGKMKPQTSTEIRHGSSRIVDGGAGRVHPHGQATAAESLSKASLRAYVRNHTANEIAERCRVEPSFRKALDGGLDE